MNLQTILYFVSVVVTFILTGCLAWYAWRQPPVEGVRAYAGLALGECLLALVEILSMVSGTEAQAHFWFNLRFLFTGIMPVLFLVFTLEYYGRRDWLTKPLLAVAFIIPLLSQVILWTNGLHGLWVKQDVGFHQNGPFWMAEPGARIPAVWFMVHSLYSLALLLAGMVVIALTAWRMRQGQRGQALLLVTGALVALITALIPVFNLLPRLAFNPFIPGIGISAGLYALAVFRFQFLKRSPAQASARPEAGENHSLAIFAFIFVLFASGIVAIGYVSYRNYASQFRAQVESQLAATGELKVSQLETWRSERVGDAEILQNTPAFAALVQTFLEAPDDAQASVSLQAWLEAVRKAENYERISLLDTKGVERLASPGAPAPVSAYLGGQAVAALGLGQVTFMDFHRDAPDGPIHLAVLSPIYAQGERSRPLGVVVLRIDPAAYLYPYINQWPTPSSTAETLLVRRDGDNVLFLNELRFEQNTALTLRIPLENTQVLAVKAVLGQTGIVEGVDYRGVPAIGYVSAIPASPWFLVARMNTAEVYAPLQERLWQTVLFLGALILAAGAGLLLVWRQQRVRYYRGQVETLEALRTLEVRYRRLFEAARDGILILDAETGVVVDVNPFLVEMLGFPREGILGKELWELGFLKDIVANKANFLELQQKKYIHYENLPMETAQGKRIQVEFVSYVYQVGGGKVIQCNIRDITERKRAEEALRESEDKFKYVFDYSSVGKSLTQLSGGMQVNQAFCELLGYSPEEFQSKKWQEITHPDDIELNLKEIQRLYSGEKESARFTKRYLHKNGSVVWVDVSTSLRRDGQGQPLYLMNTVIDITGRKQMEDALRENEARFRSLYENSTVGIYRTTPDGRILLANPTLVGMLGYSTFEELMANNLEADDFGPDYPRSKFLETIEKDGEVKDLEASWKRRDGTTIYIRESARAVKDAQGKTLYYDGAIEDITERKRAEEQIVHYTAHLEEIVETRTRDLRQAQERLVRQERLAALGQLAGSVSHELRNPLGVISNAVYFLEMAQPGANAKVKEYLGIIDKETRTADKIITDLLDFTRIKSAQREAVSVAGLVKQALERYPPPAGVSVRLDLPPGLPPVSADPGQMTQVLGNLVTNAYQAMPERGLVTVSSGQCSVDSDQWVLISVQDSGAGIPDEDIIKLFTPLFTTKARGIGLGLAICKNLVEANGGRIEVHSEVGKGSTFTVYLPIYKEAA